MDAIGGSLFNDKFAKSLGIEILDASEGAASGRMQVTDAILNGNDAVHAGALFTLASVVFNAVANGTEAYAGSTNIGITYLKPAKGEAIFARANLVSEDENSARYSVTVTDDRGDLLAKFEATRNLPAAQSSEGEPALRENGEPARPRPRRRSVLPVQQYD